MRHWIFPVFLLGGHCVQAQVRINELQCTRVVQSDGRGTNGDWVELYNAGDREVDLGGYILSLGGRTEHLAPGLAIGPHRHLVLWCDRSPDEGPAHLVMRLPRHGGGLLLVAPDGSTVLDLFHWPALPPGVSIGRLRDGGRDWGYFASPTPGRPNEGSTASARLLPLPEVAAQGNEVRISSVEGSTIRYTLDGSLPDSGSPPYAAPLEVAPGTVVRARGFAPDALAGPCASFSAGMPDTAWALMVAPQDLEGADGIADVPSGNFARKGRKWQRQAALQRGEELLPVGIAIAGSGSRSLPKRNFRLLVRDRFGGGGKVGLPDGTAWKDVILRADGSPHAFLRNAFMEAVARQSGSRVEVQPGSPLPLYLNGHYHGLYRAMPAKGKEWVRSLNHGGPVELIEGAGARAVSGKARHYLRMVHAIAAGQPLDSLERWADPGSLVDLACFDLWTGRADHDLNVRCWRPRTPDGRWRWIMFDMDQWAPAEDATVQRLCSSAVPETPFIPQLLADCGTRALLLARLSALLATTLAPDRAAAAADSIYFRHRGAMARDQARWAHEMDVPAPAAAHADLLEHIAGRNPALLEQLSRHTGLALRTVSVQVEPPGSGRVLVEDLPLTDTGREMRAFAEVPLHLRARAGAGMEFAGWKGAEGEGDRLVASPRRNMHITAVFRPVAVSGQGGFQQGAE